MFLHYIFVPAHCGACLGFCGGEMVHFGTAFINERQQQFGVKTFFFCKLPGDAETEVGKVIGKDCRQMEFPPDSGVCFCDFI